MSNIISQIEAEQMTRELPEFNPGDTVVVLVDDAAVHGDSDFVGGFKAGFNQDRFGVLFLRYFVLRITDVTYGGDGFEVLEHPDHIHIHDVHYTAHSLEYVYAALCTYGNACTCFPTVLQRPEDQSPAPSPPSPTSPMLAEARRARWRLTAARVIG